MATWGEPEGAVSVRRAGAGRGAQRAYPGRRGPSGAAVTATPKSKSLAVVLAVVLAFWTWLYTYEVDAGKFWTGMVLTLVAIPLFFAYVGFPILLAVWLWAVLDTASKSKAWFEAYPDVTAP